MAMLALIGLFCSLASVGMFRALASRGDRRAELLGIVAGQEAPPTTSILVALGRTRLARLVGDGERLRKRLTLAGLDGRHEAALGGRAVAGLACLALCGVAALHGAGLALVASPLLVVVAIRVPDIALARMGRRRQERIAARVPDLVELLVTTTRAGLSPSVAFRRSASVLRGPLADEVALAVRAMDLGMPWADALQDLVERTHVPALRRLSVALARSSRLGSSVGTTLRVVAEDLRKDRQARAEEAARRAPVKMLFPLVFLVLPAFLLLTVGPVVLATIKALR